MKDKRAKALKQRRQAKRQAMRDDEMREVAKRFGEHCEKNGITKKFKKQDVYRISKEIALELTKEAILDCLTVTAYCLNRTYGWGKVRLMRYTHGVHRIIKAIGNNERGLNKLAEELIDETGIDIKSYFDGYVPYNGIKQTDSRKQRAVCIMECVPVWLVSCMYVMYFDYGFKHKRLDRLMKMVRVEIVPMVEYLQQRAYIEKVRKVCKLNIGTDGMISAV